MKKIILINFLMLMGLQAAFSQVQNIKDLYWDYTQIRMVPAKRAMAKDKAQALLLRSAELNQKQIANLNFHLGRLYEETGEPNKAIPCYEQVIKITPGYYVTYRAMGFINLKKCDSLGKKVTAAAKAKNGALHAESFKNYKKQILKTIPYFEKAQACDPDENTLNMITSLYTSIKDAQSVATLNTRLKPLGVDCISLLDDE